jgi:hypothetical protein
VIRRTGFVAGQAGAEDLQVDPGPAAADAEVKPPAGDLVSSAASSPSATGCRLDRMQAAVPTRRVVVRPSR